MGCGSSLNQVTDYHHMVGSSKPLRLDQMFHNHTSLNSLTKIYLFGETQTKRKILELSLQDKSQLLTLKKLSERYHIPRPKLQRDTIEMMYEQAQEALPANMYNSTTLPPFNLMFVTLLSQKVLFLCGGIDFQFWNVCAESFLYKIAYSPVQQDKLIKVKLQKPQTNIIAQKTSNHKENSSRRSFNKFQRLAFMNQARYSHMGLSIKHPISGKNCVYVFGGFNSNKETLKSCEVYSFEKNSWEKIPDMKIARATGFCFEYLQKLYVCGGFTHQGKRSKKIEVWDLEAQKWSVLNQGYITSFSPNEIAIVGGNIEGGSTRSVIKFNLIEETYKWDSDLIYSDSLQKAFNNEGRLYLFGGKKPGFCQIYNSLERSWSQHKVTTTEDIKPGELTMFSASTNSLSVDFVPISNRRKEVDFDIEDLTVFGTDFYPILYFYKGKDVVVASSSVSMKLRLRKNMGILRISQDEYFLCGGIDSFQTNSTKATFNYKVSSRTVEELDKMPIKKHKFGMIKHKNYVYSAGGAVVNEKKEETELKDCCRYNLLTKKWEKIAELNFCRSQCSIVEAENGLLLFGGYADGEWVDKVEFLNTENDKNPQFHALVQKLPLLFPMFSKIISTKKHTQTTVKLFVLNRNIHLNNFEEVYFNLNLNKLCRTQGCFHKNNKDYDLNINKLQQFDSIDVIITERQKTLEKENTNRSIEDGNKIKIREQDDANSDSEGVDISASFLVHKKESRVPKSKKLIRESTDKLFQEEPKIPEVQQIKIKSRNQSEEFDETEVNGYKLNRVSNGLRNSVDHKNLIGEHCVSIEEMSLEFENVHLNDQKGLAKGLTVPAKLVSTHHASERNEKNEGYENLKSEPMEEYPNNVTIENKGVTLPSKLEMSENWVKKQVNTIEPHFIEEISRKVIKGLDCIDNINDWIRVKETVTSNRVVFVRNEELVKCNITVKSGEQVKINVIKEKYENGELLFDKSNNFNNSHLSKLHTSKIRQVYS